MSATLEKSQTPSALATNANDLEELLRSISAWQIGDQEIQSFYGKIADAAANIMGAEFAALQLLHSEKPDHGELQLLAWTGFRDEIAQTWEWIRSDADTACALALRNGIRTIISDMDYSGFLPDTPFAQLYRSLDIRAVVALPLLTRSGKRVGMISTYWRQPTTPSDRNLALLDILGRQAADLIEQRKAEHLFQRDRREADQQRRLYETILSTTPDLAYVFDLNHRFIYANKVLLKMWNKTWEEAIGKNCLELGYEPWHAAMHDREIDEVIATRQMIRGEVPFNGAFGRRIYDYVFSPVLNADGNVEAIVGTTRDITVLKENEERLRDAAEKAKAATKAKTDFLANMSHEIRTPMNAVVGLSHILDLSSNLSAREKECVTTIKSSAAHLMSLINDMLDISKIEANKVELENSPFKPAGLILDCIKLIKLEAEKKRLSLDIDQKIASNLQLCGDAHRIRQVVTNLLSNAVKFTDQGKVSVRSDCAGGDQVTDAKIHLVVEDTGIGMSPETLGRIFEKFTQADSSMSRKYGGTGLGLAISKQLVELMGGTISVESNFGVGTTITVMIQAKRLLIDEQKS